MTPAELFATVLGVGALVVSGGGWWISAAAHKRAENDHAEARGQATQRLSNLETWQQSKSIDRSEFVALTQRVDGVEREVDRVCDQVAEVAKQVAVSDARLIGLADHMKASTDGLSHQMKNLRMSFEATSPRVRQQPDA